VEQAAARTEGKAAMAAEDSKRRRYPGGRMTPVAIEAGGRWGKAGLAVLRAIYKDNKEALFGLHAEIACAVQAHTSSMVRAALGSP